MPQWAFINPYKTLEVLRVSGLRRLLWQTSWNAVERVVHALPRLRNVALQGMASLISHVDDDHPKARAPPTLAALKPHLHPALECRGSHVLLPGLAGNLHATAGG